MSPKRLSWNVIPLPRLHVFINGGIQKKNGKAALIHKYVKETTISFSYLEFNIKEFAYVKYYFI